MDLHPNWIALCTVDFHRKTFVTPSENTANSSINRHSQPCTSSLDGNEVKSFYMDVISSESKPIEKKMVTNVPVLKMPKPNKPPLPRLPLTRRLTTKFLTAAQENSADTVRELLSQCPQLLNSQDDFGWTALMCAVKEKSYETVDFLLTSGADRFIKDNRGKTAENLSESRSISYLLQSYSVKPESTPNDRVPDESYERVVCNACDETYTTDAERVHKASTLHVFNSNKGNKMPTHYGIAPTNRGFQLMLKKGWDKEKGLGPDGIGQKFPVKTVLRPYRAGLGKEVDAPKVTHFHAGDLKAVENRRNTLRSVNKTNRLKSVAKDKNFEKKFRLEFYS